MRGAAWWAGPQSGLADVGVLGQGWQSTRGDACPTIYGPRGGLIVENITGIAVNVNQDGSDSEDTVVVMRERDEPYYCGLRPSLVARVAELHGTSRPWRLMLG